MASASPIADTLPKRLVRVAIETHALRRGTPIPSGDERAADATFTLARDHWHTEQIIRRTDAFWTFLRMNLYMDFISSMVSADGIIRGPAGDGRLAAVLPDDVAAAAAAALTSEGHDGLI